MIVNKYMVLRDHEADDGGGNEAFETKVLDGVKTLTDESKANKKRTDSLTVSIEKMLTDVERLDSNTKKVMEDIETHKKVANDTASEQKAMLGRFQLLDARIRMEAKSSFGCPVKRLVSEPEAALRLNIAIRMNSSRGAQRSICKGLADKADPSIRKEILDAVKRDLDGDGSPGSTLIDDHLSNQVYDTLQSFGIWSTFEVVPVSTKTNKFAVQTARPIALWLAENAQIADDTNKAGGSVSLEAQVCAVLLNVSDSLLEDAETDLSGNIMTDFAEATSYRLDWSALQADGTADTTDGSYTGVFGGGGTAAAAAAGNITAEGTDLEDWMRCLLTVDPAVLQRPARWWMHNQMVVRSLGVRDLNGRPIFQTALEAPSPGAIGSILGYPVTPCAAAPTANAANAKIAVFGDPRGLVVGMRRTYGFAYSDQFRWDYAQRSFRGIGRAGVKVKRAEAFAVLTLPAA